jgi:hypothetical protein
MKPHSIIIEGNNGRGHRRGMHKIKKDVLKYSIKKEYYTLPHEVKVLTINFVDLED